MKKNSSLPSDEVEMAANIPMAKNIIHELSILNDVTLSQQS